jgi:phosphoserine phosphatase RsbU/P
LKANAGPPLGASERREPGEALRFLVLAGRRNERQGSHVIATPADAFCVMACVREARYCAAQGEAGPRGNPCLRSDRQWAGSRAELVRDDAFTQVVSRLMASVADTSEHRLEGLLSVTDSAVTTLKIEEFLTELLKRVRDVVEADTATVLLLDEESNELVATAACGLEEEVRVGVRVPVGRGFAGRVAAERQVVTLAKVDATTVTNPILWEKGIQVMLGVPLLADDKVIGVLHVGRLDNRPFTNSDTELLAIVAERLAGATQNRLLVAERAAATLQQRSLLPTRLPKCAGIEFAARYLTPEDRTVGGDWYDLFTLPSGELCVVTGDVAGHGLNAAVIMGRVRSALRAYALMADSPEGILELTDRKVLHFE